MWCEKCELWKKELNEARMENRRLRTEIRTLRTYNLPPATMRLLKTLIVKRRPKVPVPRRKESVSLTVAKLAGQRSLPPATNLKTHEKLIGFDIFQ